MRRLPVADAQPDMILATDVINGQEMLLLKKGISLNANNIKMLKSWGVTFIEVESDPVSKTEVKDSDHTGELIEIEERVRKKFGQTDENEVMGKIRQVATDILIGRFHHKDAVDAG